MNFAKGLQVSIKHESGIRFASRALAYGTALAVISVGSLSYLAWRIAGVNKVSELGNRFRSTFPDEWKLKPTDPSTNFQTADELISYVTKTSKANESGTKV